MIVDVNLSAGHWNGLHEQGLFETSPLERRKSAGGDGKVDRATANGAGYSRIASLFKHNDDVPRLGEFNGEQTPREPSATDNNAFGLNRHSDPRTSAVCQHSSNDV
jgi:hypothetical protein